MGLRSPSSDEFYLIISYGLISKIMVFIIAVCIMPSSSTLLSSWLMYSGEVSYLLDVFYSNANICCILSCFFYQRTPFLVCISYTIFHTS